MTDLVSLREGTALQPQALEAGGRAISADLDRTDLSPMRGGAIALVGIGASLYAATAGAAQMREQGLRAFAFPGTDLSDPSVDAADVYVAISASGRSVEPAKAMEVRPGAATYGIAKTADTPLAKVVGTMIATHSGVDSRPNSTSYVGSMQAIGLIAERVGRPSGFDWATLPQAARSEERARLCRGGDELSLESHDHSVRPIAATDSQPPEVCETSAASMMFWTCSAWRIDGSASAPLRQA